MKKCHQKRQAWKEKVAKERDLLSQQHLITTQAELAEALEEINCEAISTTKKKQRKLTLLRTQINIRKKILNQKINIPFSHYRKQRPLATIIEELIDVIATNTQAQVEPEMSGSGPFSLVGKEVLHRFILESGEERWFHGIVISYNAANNTHELAYDGETNHQHFDLSEDIRDGDIEIV